MNRALPTAILFLALTTAAAAQFDDMSEIETSPAASVEADSTRLDDPDHDEFVPDAVDPSLDYAEFRSRVTYPEDAKKSGLEGVVLLRVLVSEEGTPLRYRVEHCDSPCFLDPSISALMASKFTPGSIAGTPARLWVSVPVRFELDD